MVSMHVYKEVTSLNRFLFYIFCILYVDVCQLWINNNDRSFFFLFTSFCINAFTANEKSSWDKSLLKRLTKFVWCKGIYFIHSCIKFLLLTSFSSFCIRQKTWGCQMIKLNSFKSHINFCGSKVFVLEVFETFLCAKVFDRLFPMCFFVPRIYGKSFKC